MHNYTVKEFVCYDKEFSLLSLKIIHYNIIIVIIIILTCRNESSGHCHGHSPGS